MLILPSKHVSQDRALLSIGAKVLSHLSHPSTASALWEKMQTPVIGNGNAFLLRYDVFVLALDLLFLMGTIEFESGLLYRRAM
jgi:hypothetical protein